MEDTKKNNFGLIISCIFNVILIGILIGVIMHNHFFVRKSDSIDNGQNITKVETKEENATSNEGFVQGAEKTNEDTNSVETNDLIYTVKVKKDEPFEEEGIKYEEISVPQININNDDVKRINIELKEYGQKDAYYDLKEEHYIYKNILSLLITSNTPGDTSYYFVYNIDIATGNILTNTELLNKLERTDNLHKKLSDIVNKVIDEKTQSLPNDYSKYVSISFNNSYGPEIQMPIFVKEDGKLYTIVYYTIPAGSGGPWGVIEVVD